MSNNGKNVLKIFLVSVDVKLKSAKESLQNLDPKSDVFEYAKASYKFVIIPIFEIVQGMIKDVLKMPGLDSYTAEKALTGMASLLADKYQEIEQKIVTQCKSPQHHQSLELGKTVYKHLIEELLYMIQHIPA